MLRPPALAVRFAFGGVDGNRPMSIYQELGDAVRLRDTGHLTLETGERWFCVQTQPRRELSSDAQLRAQGFRTFVPQIATTIRHARKLSRVRRPLFPNYLFVILDLGKDRWRSVNGTFGVSRMIMAGDQPEPVPENVVETLISFMDEGGVVRFTSTLRVGQTVRVLTGPFANAIGSLERLDANGRVRILLDIMGGRIPATLSAAELAPAG